MIADIATGHVDAADVLFLIAAILFGVAALLPLRVRPLVIDAMLIPAGLCLVAVAWLVL
jgi:hypothetical protein